MTYTGRHRAEQPFVTDTLAVAHHVGAHQYPEGVAFAYVTDGLLHQINLPTPALAYLHRVFGDALKETP